MSATCDYLESAPPSTNPIETISEDTIDLHAVRALRHSL